MVDEISSVEEFSNASKKDVAIIDFHADWCMPCLMMAPIIDEISEKKEMRKVHFIKVNVDDYPEISEKFGIMSIPTMVVLKKGKEAGRIIGASSVEALEEKLKKFL